MMGPAEYLGHQLLLKLQERQGHVSRSVFFKTWCITSRYLEDELECNVELPRYWYKYGEIVDEISMNDDFYYSRTMPWGRKYIPLHDLSVDDFDVDESTRSKVDKGVKWAASRFGKRNTAYVKNYQYSIYSPNEFIRTYSSLRDYLEYTDLDEQAPLARYPDFNSNQDVVIHLLDEMQLTFPEDRFDEMHRLYLRWDDTARLLLDQEDDFSEFNEFLDEFIEALSRVEIQLKYHENIPEPRLQRWFDEREITKETFEDSLSDKRQLLMQEREPSSLLNKVSESFDETVSADLNSHLSRGEE